MRRTVARAAALAALCLAPLACTEQSEQSEQGEPASTSARPPARTFTVAPAIDYGWGQASHAIGGVSVRVHRPVLRPTSGELSRVGMRAMTCDVEVTNGGPSEVFIGIAGQIGNRAIVPLSEPPAAIPPKGIRTVERVLYVPDAVPAAIRLHVSASTNGAPIRDGWRFVGPVDR